MTTRAIYRYAIYLLGVIATSACEKFLDVEPQGELSEATFLSSEEGVEGVVIGVYSMLNGQYNEITNAHRSGPSNWIYGDVVSDDAYKGSSGISDGSDAHLLEVFAASADVQAVLIKWEAMYEGISRANKAINIIENFTGWDEIRKNERTAEVKVLRGYFYFELKKMFNHIPYINENNTPSNFREVSNRDYSSDELWQLIESDFLFGADNLPLIQPEAGRVSAVTARGMLAKVYAYQQKWPETVAAAEGVLTNPGRHYLLTHFEDVFLQILDGNGADVCAECLFEVQHSLDPGLPSSTPDVGATYGWDGNVGDRLSGLGGPYPRVYGFHRPSQNLANSYKTDDLGLPVFNDFNDANVTLTDRVDPRLDHTIGRPGVPFLDAGVYEDTWTRGVSTYGSFAGKKQLYPVGGNHVINIPYYTNNENFCILRLADVILLLAEAHAEMGNLEAARQQVNTIRRRARDGRYVMAIDGTGPAANYLVEEYTEPWPSLDYAREAVRRERRLELAMEGQRFFDLVRWGVAADIINHYIEEEKNLRTYLSNAQFQSGKHEYFPIPKSEVDISEGRLIQNPGY